MNAETNPTPRNDLRRLRVPNGCHIFFLFFWLLCNCAVFLSCLKWSSHEAKIEKKVSETSWRKKMVRFCVAFVFFRAKGFSGIGVVGHEVKHSSTRVVRMTFDEFAQLVVIMPSCHIFFWTELSWGRHLVQFSVSNLLTFTDLKKSISILRCLTKT